MKRTELTKNLSSVESNSPRADICRTLIGALILAGLAFHATALAAGLVVVDNQPLVVDAAANTASGWVLLQNTSAESSNFMLSAGSFVSGATTQALSARISLQTSGAPYLKVNLAPTSSLPVKV